MLNSSPAVSDPTRRRVLAVIEELGYEPNAAAQALSTGRTRTVGIVAPFFTQPSVVSRLRGVSDAICAAGYQLVLFDAARPGALSALPVPGRLDGLLCLSVCPSEPELARLRSAGVAVALIDGEHPELPGVSSDDVAGGAMAVHHLVELGHRRIAFVGDHERTAWGFVSSAHRRAGAEAAAAEAGVELVARRGPHGRAEARALAADLLAGRRPPTAVFAPSDLQALGVLDAAEAAGIDVPGELSVVGFDDIDVARDVGLTTIAQPLERSGRLGAELLVEAMDGARRRTCRLDLRLVRRATTAPRGSTARRQHVRSAPAGRRRRFRSQDGVTHSA